MAWVRRAWVVLMVRPRPATSGWLPGARRRDRQRSLCHALDDDLAVIAVNATRAQLGGCARRIDQLAPLSVIGFRQQCLHRYVHELGVAVDGLAVGIGELGAF